MQESDLLFSMEGFKKEDIQHWGIKGMKWGVRRYQNPDGTLTPEGKRRYSNPDGSLNAKGYKKLDVKTYERAREAEEHRNQLENKYNQLKKSIPGLKFQGSKLRVEKDGVDIQLDSSGRNMPNEQFKKIYDNAGKYKKQMMDIMKKHIMEDFKDDPEYIEMYTKNPTDFYFFITDDKGKDVDCGYYAMNDYYPADVHTEFDLSGDIPKMLFSDVSIDD